MIADHNGCDITNPASLREWASKMLEKHGDSHVSGVGVGLLYYIDE